MPVYADAKVRDMSRSVLPATRNRARSTRRNLDMIRRTARRQTKAQLRQAQAHAINFDELELDGWPYRRIREQVQDRRLADNVSALVRWAPRASAHLRVEDRCSWVRARMPDSIIGWHAMTHVRYADGMAPDLEHEGVPYTRWLVYNRQRLESWRFERYCAVYEALYRIIESGRLCQFNHEIKHPCLEMGVGWSTARTLHGVHDIESYIASVYGASGPVAYRGEDPIVRWEREWRSHRS
jgi:hypothetical protein